MRNYEKIKGFIKETPLLRSDFLSNLVGGEVFLKCENQ
jgi:threonine dehydratase